MADIYSLRAELSRQQSINSELRSELNALISGINNAHRSMINFRDRANNSIDIGTGRMTRSYNYIVESIAVQDDIDRLYVAFKNMELANKKIKECNNKKYYDFANYRTVRKIVQGMLDNINLNLISDKTIYASVEKSQLQTPDYWLTCVLISVMAWRNNDRDLADRAMTRALELDRKNSAVFYMLFNLRMCRDDAALKWFYIYKECSLTGSDEPTFLMLFSLICCNVEEMVDEKAKTEIFDFINNVIAANASAEGFDKTAIIALIVKYLSAMTKPKNLNYSLLSRHVADYKNMQSAMLYAENNKNIQQFIEETLDVSDYERNEYIAAFIQEIVEAPNQEEIGVYEEIEFNEQVIACKGNMQEASTKFYAEKNRRKNNLNLIRTMIEWCYSPQRAEINHQIKKNVFILTGSLNLEAANAYISMYRSLFKPRHVIKLDQFSTETDFRNYEEDSRKQTAFYNDLCDQELKTVKNLAAYILFGVCAAGIAGAIALDFEVLLFILAGLCAAAGGIVLLVNNQRKKNIRKNYDHTIANQNDLLAKLYQEYAAFWQEFMALDEQHKLILDEFQKL